MQSVDHYALQTTLPSEALLSDIPTSEEPLTGVTSANKLRPTLTEVDGPLPHLIPLDQSMLEEKEFNDASLAETEEEAASKQESRENRTENGGPLSLRVSVPLPDKRPEQKKSATRSTSHRSQKPNTLPSFYGHPAAVAPTGLHFHQDHSYSSMVHMNHLSDALPSSQTNPLLLQCHLPPAGYHIARPGLDEPVAFQSCPCYLSHGFAPHSAPPYPHVYVPIQPGSAPFAPVPTPQDPLLLPDMYAAPRQTLIPAQPYQHMEHIFPYEPNYQRHSFVIPFAVQEALTTLQPSHPTSAAPVEPKERPIRGKKELSRKRELDGVAKLGEDASKKSKLEHTTQPGSIPSEALAMQHPHMSMGNPPPYYRADNMVPYIPTNFNSYYPPFLSSASNLPYQQGPVPFYPQPLEPEKRQQSRRALFQYQGVPPTDDSLGVHPLENTPKKIASPTSTNVLANSETESTPSTQGSLTVTSDQLTPGNLRQNRVNIPPPISVPPHINNFIISDTL